MIEGCVFLGRKLSVHMYNILRKKRSASWFHSSPDATLSDLKTVCFSTRNDPLHEM